MSHDRDHLQFDIIESKNFDSRNDAAFEESGDS